MSIVIEGKITIDGVESQFECSSEDPWSQWGAVRDRLCESVSLVEKIEQAIQEEPGA